MSEPEIIRPAIEICKLPNMQWMVARSKPRCEKKLDEFCQARGILSYLPLRRSVRRYAKRVVVFQVPIFSGYVFCQVPQEAFSLVNESRHTAHLLRPTEEMERQLVEELRSVQIFERAMQEGEITVRPEIEIGTAVRLKSGPLAGLQGIVTRWKNKVRVTVNVDMVGQCVSVEMDATELEIDF